MSNSLLRRLRRATAAFRDLPLHPQWLIRKPDNLLNTHLRSIAAGGLVIDVGCGHRWPERVLPPGCHYIGLDHPTTATAWYGSRPDLFADASALPLPDQCANLFLLLDVVEHLPDPDTALQEASRVLKPGGTLLLRIPYAYPLHDEPLDFQRYTRHGINALARRHGFTVEQLVARGHPVVTGTLLLNLGLTKTIVNGLAGNLPMKAGALLLMPCAGLVITLGNLVATLLARVTPDDDFLPYSYTAILRR